MALYFSTLAPLSLVWAFPLSHRRWGHQRQRSCQWQAQAQRSVKFMISLFDTTVNLSSSYLTAKNADFVPEMDPTARPNADFSVEDATHSSIGSRALRIRLQARNLD
ncbi:hypothetical protein BDR22DRAFT_819037 [Usnea florida]